MDTYYWDCDDYRQLKYCDTYNATTFDLFGRNGFTGENCKECGCVEDSPMVVSLMVDSPVIVPTGTIDVYYKR